ncbi:hypothetical protein KJ966_12365 [bacterium]|nr:hypothetical protein [bacterium]
MEVAQLNPYTKAMLNCLQQFEGCEGTPTLDDTNSQFLANMIQGRFLQYLANRICRNYDITGKDLEKRLTMSLTRILSDKFFAVFREKVKEKPEIVYILAKKITEHEISCRNDSTRLDVFFRNISQKYFKYQNFKIIMRWIDTNPEIERIVFLSKVQKRIKDSSLLKALMYIVQNDKDGITPSVFNRYLNKNKLDRLKSIVKNGDWQIEALFVQQQNAKLINWRNYMNSI